MPSNQKNGISIASCKGDSIKVWINEVLVTDRDGLDSSGVIASGTASPKLPTMEPAGATPHSGTGIK